MLMKSLSDSALKRIAQEIDEPVLEEEIEDPYSLTENDIKVLKTLANLQEKYEYVALYYIARDLGMSTRSVGRILSKLEKPKFNLVIYDDFNHFALLSDSGVDLVMSL